MSIQTTALQISNFGVKPQVHAVRGDGGRILICQLSGISLTGGETAKFWALKPSGAGVFSGGTISATDNTVTVELTTQTLAEDGITAAQVEIQDSDGKNVSTFAFDIVVHKNVSGDYPESANETTFVTAAIQEIYKTIAESEDATATAKDAANTATTAAATANTAAGTANTAASGANAAATTAKDAASTATSAASTANSAADTANTAASNADSAASTANNAATTATNAATTATNAASTATSAATAANNAATTAKDAASTATSAAGTANTAASNANSAASTATTAASNANTAATAANEAAAAAISSLRATKSVYTGAGRTLSYESAWQDGFSFQGNVKTVNYNGGCATVHATYGYLTAKYTGYYLATVSMFFRSTSDAIAGCAMYDNNTAVRILQALATVSQSASVFINNTALVYLTAGDYIKWSVYGIGTMEGIIDESTDAGQENTYMQLVYLGE